MKTKIIYGFLCLVLLNIHSCDRAYNKENGKQHSAHDHPVRALFLSSIKAFNKGDLDLFLVNFAQDIKMYGTDGNYIGHKALRERFEIVFRQFPNKKMEIPELTLQVLSKEVVLVNFKWKLYPMGQGPAYSGVGTGLYNYRNHKWMEILEVETITHIDEELKQQRIN